MKESVTVQTSTFSLQILTFPLVTHLVDTDTHPVGQSHSHHLLQVLHGRAFIDLLHDELGDELGDVPLQRTQMSRRLGNNSSTTRCTDAHALTPSLEFLKSAFLSSPVQGYTHFIPLRCMIHSTMVAFTQNRIKKSTLSARNLWRGEGMLYSCPVEKSQCLYTGQIYLSTTINSE